MKVGFIGIGAIADIMAREIKKIEGIDLIAAYGRTLEKAEEFAATHQVPFFTNQLEDFLNFSEIDLIYIATPHIYHYQYTREALQQNKHVLCEKPLALNHCEAAELFSLAKEKNLFLGEAFWTRFNPVFKELQKIQRNQLIGSFKSLITNIGGNSRTNQRLIDLQLGGGALMDTGIYGLNLLFETFGTDYNDYTTIVNIGETGVDLQHTLCFNYCNDSSGVLNATIQVKTLNGVLISGEKGYIKIDHPSEFNQLEVFNEEREIIYYQQLPEGMTGYTYEWIAVKDCIEAGCTELEEVPPKFTLDLLTLTDQIRRDWGMNYPTD
ncbi:Gfo/Idh/MocA family protein [Enterococcus sp. AZ072]|uniref:Gfo/Idh/MocA family protein n=1 Tax=unclassified Enterococcus TaxID=2608891 RepID=UPI003D2913DC